MNPNPRILVVDDDAAGRLLARATLVRAGCEVIEAQDGQAALQAIQTEAPDLVLMDVNMPVMDGFTACSKLRELAHAQRVPVLMMTARDDMQSIERAFHVGATDFIAKPINWTILAHRVRYLLRASHAINDLAQNQLRLSNAQRIGDMGDWEWDVARENVTPSEQARLIFGLEGSQGEFDPRAFLSTVHSEDAHRLQSEFDRAIAAGQPFAIEHRVIRPDGSTRHVHQQVVVTARDASGRASVLAGAVHDITQRKQAEEQIWRLAHYDPLTGLPNRLLFVDRLHQAIAHAKRHGKRVAIMFIDLDHFKRVNDTLGHAAGDELLRVVGTRLEQSIRASDSVSSERGDATPAARGIARLGGDEFSLMLGDMDNAADAANVAQRLMAALAVPLIVQCTELYISASVGVAMYPDDGADVDALLMNADTAMYRAKEAGRGGFQFYDESMNARALERLVMEGMLRKALERSEFVLHYQPRISLTQGRIVGAEALIRWQHPERGWVSPQEFIPLAEEAGLIIPIGEWAIDAACRQSAAWRAEGIEFGPVAVNLASTHLRVRTLPELVARALREHALPPCALELEVTESMLMADPELCVETARQLSNLGVSLSIDDFGTGYSSLSYLKRLPIKSLKIDQSFVRNLTTDPDDAAIITAINAMAHTLKLKVIAEGVETEAQRAFLQAGGCDEFQGYLACRAVEAGAFARLVQAQHSARRVPVAA
ncbi:MAG: EAL domain-containing protein [Burkholderiaceae bacterium]